MLLVIIEEDDDWHKAYHIKPLPKVGEVLIPTKYINLVKFNYGQEDGVGQNQVSKSMIAHVVNDEDG